MNFLYRLLGRLFGGTVDSIVADFERKAVKLDALAARKIQEYDALIAEIEYLDNLAVNASSERIRASVVADRIRHLISDA